VTSFVYFDVLNVPTYEPKEQQSTPQVSTTETNPTTGLSPHSQLLARAEPPKRPLDDMALAGLVKAIKWSIRYDGNFANLADVGDYLSRISPDLNARNYGYERLREFVTASGITELKWKHMGNNPPVALVRLKERPDI
jgi:hypothetical protein